VGQDAGRARRRHPLERRARRLSRLARNTSWNLAGALLPIPVALVCIPILVRALGVERFGVLGLAWMLLGYFGMFDFGLAQSTTRSVSHALAAGQPQKLAALARGSALLHAALGLAGGGLFVALTPWLVHTVFNIPDPLVDETRHALYLLAASVPALVLTAALRGVLEGVQRFDTVNLIRIPAAMVNYAGPTIALAFGSGLPLVVGVIVVARYAVLAAYAIACRRALPPGSARLEGAELVRLASYGGWLTATSFLNPLIIGADRFVIAAAVSVGAVAFYVTPYEVITKTWIISASLLGAMFPLFAAMAAREPSAIRGTCRAAEIYLLAAAAPIVLVILGCADLLLEWWLGTEFRANSTRVAQLLALGILINVVAQAPLTALNATGRADVTTGIALVELPLYVMAAWHAAARYGIDGVAAVWAVRAALDAAALFVAAHFLLPAGPAARGRYAGLASVLAFLAAGAWLAHALPHSAASRLGLLAVLLCALLAWEWRGLLGRDERQQFIDLCSRSYRS
jgi:O-antigen/teichoic acid export membrane protein